MAWTQKASDNFAGTGALDANWTKTTGAAGPLTRSSGQAVNSTTFAGGFDGSYYSGIAWDNDQYSEGLAGALDVDGVNEAGYCARVAAGADSFYAIIWQNINAAASVGIHKHVAGASSQIGASFSMDTTGTPLIRIEVLGSTITVYRNGIQIAQRTDTDLTAGSPGISAGDNFGGGFSHLDDWAGGDNTGGFKYNVIRP